MNSRRQPQRAAAAVLYAWAVEIVDLDLASVREGGRVTLTARGEVDIANGSQLRAAGLAALEGETSELVIDLTGVPFMDSAGLGHLTWVLRVARPRPVRMLIAHPEVVRLFHMTGLSSRSAASGLT